MTEEAEGEPEARSEALPIVEMIQAFRWICPGCSKENFDRATKVTFQDEEEEAEVREALGFEAGDGNVVSVPEVVTCGGCLLMCATG